MIIKMALSDDFILELKQRNDIRSVVSSYIELKGNGQNPKGLCPFHGEKTPSFTLYTDSDSFYCFGCSTGGDVIRFIMLIENLDYIEAVKLLAERSGMQMPVQGVDDTYVKIKNTVLSINRESARFFHNQLVGRPDGEGMKYFRERCLADTTINHFGLGYAPDGWQSLADHLKTKGFSEEDMIIANVVSRGKNGGVYDRFRRRMMFPIFDLRGNVIGFSGRKMPDDSESAKYVNTADTPVYKKSDNVFALNFAKAFCADRLILCEGQMDVISLHQAGFQNTVAPLGTSFTPSQAHLLSRYTKEIVITMDSDTAGQKATARAIEIVKSEGVGVKIIRIPGNKDPDEFLKQWGVDGPERFKMLLEDAGNDIEYALVNAKSEIDIETDSGKNEYLKRATDILSNIKSPVEVEIYASRLAEETQITKATILKQVESEAAKKRRMQKKRDFSNLIKPNMRRDNINPEKANHLRAANAEEGLLSIFFRNPDYIKRLSGGLNSDLFITSFNKKIYEWMLERINSGRVVDVSLMSDEFTGEELGKIIEMQVRERNRSNTVAECCCCIDVMREENEKIRINVSLSGQESDEDFKKIMETISKNKNKGAAKNGEQKN